MEKKDAPLKMFHESCFTADRLLSKQTAINFVRCGSSCLTFTHNRIGSFVSIKSQDKNNRFLIDK